MKFSPASESASQPLLRLDPACGERIAASDKVAIAVSGGADSIALFHLLRETFPEKELYAYTVDHALRSESANEAMRVHKALSLFCTHRILRWDGAKPKTGLQEAARSARYALLQGQCAEDGVTLLCLAHHADDQAETVLHRLAKGSGLDGLTGMRAIAPMESITLLRPLLHVSHADLTAYCRQRALDWMEDPSNENERFARVRLRAARRVLEAEGLSNERLNRLSHRLSRAREALDFYADQLFDPYVDLHERMAVIAADAKTLPEEIYLRLVLKAASRVQPEHALASKLERLEDMLAQASPYKTTLGRIMFQAFANGTLRLQPELISVN